MRRAVICEWTEDGKKEWDSVGTNLSDKDATSLVMEMRENSETVNGIHFGFRSISQSDYDKKVLSED